MMPKSGFVLLLVSLQAASSLWSLQKQAGPQWLVCCVQLRF